MRLLITILCLFVVVLLAINIQDESRLNSDQVQIAKLVQRINGVESQTQNLMAFKSDMKTLSVKLEKLHEVLAQPAVGQASTCGSSITTTSGPATVQP